MRITTRIVWEQLAAAVAVAVAVFLIVSPWHPPVGVYIAVLALLGVCVPLVRGEHISFREKTLWTGVMLLLVLLEISSIYKDRNEHDKEQADARKEQLQQFNVLMDQQHDLMTFLANHPNLTEGNLRAVVRAYSKRGNPPGGSPPGIPLASNSELHRDLSEYTTHLREIENNRGTWWSKFFPITSHYAKPDMQQARSAWDAFEADVEKQFIDRDLSHGVSLRDELLRRLHQTGPPKPMDALLGVFPDPSPSNYQRGHPFGELADYLDSLASQLPYS